MSQPNNQPTPATRDAAVDTAKALGMFLVFLGHMLESYARNWEVFQVIYAFHMPLFFLLSGYVSKALPQGDGMRGFLNFTRKQFLTLIIPATFFIWLTTLWHPVEDYFVDGYLRPKLYARMLLSPAFGIPLTCYICWFLFALFSGKLLFKLAYPAYRKAPLVTNISLFIVGILSCQYLPKLTGLVGIPDNFWYLRTAPLVAAFVMAGHYAKSLNWQPEKLAIAPKLVLATGLAALMIVAALQNNGPFPQDPEAVVLAYGQLGNPLWFLLGALTGSISLLLFADILKHVPGLPLLGRISMPMILFAGLFMVFGNLYLLLALESTLPKAPLLVCSLAALASYMISILPAWLLHRVFPQLTGQPSKQDPLLPSFTRNGSK